MIYNMQTNRKLAMLRNRVQKIPDLVYINLGLPRSMVDAIDIYRGKVPNPPNRSEAIRMLLAQSLGPSDAPKTKKKSK
jgi:hypothetical protein